MTHRGVVSTFIKKVATGGYFIYNIKNSFLKMLSGGHGGDSESNQIYPWDRLFSTLRTFFLMKVQFMIRIKML